MCRIEHVTCNSDRGDSGCGRNIDSVGEEELVHTLTRVYILDRNRSEYSRLICGFNLDGVRLHGECVNGRNVGCNADGAGDQGQAGGNDDRSVVGPLGVCVRRAVHCQETVASGYVANVQNVGVSRHERRHGYTEGQSEEHRQREALKGEARRSDDGTRKGAAGGAVEGCQGGRDRGHQRGRSGRHDLRVRHNCCDLAHLLIVTHAEGRAGRKRLRVYGINHGVGGGGRVQKAKRAGGVDVIIGHPHHLKSVSGVAKVSTIAKDGERAFAGGMIGSVIEVYCDQNLGGGRRRGD